MKKLIIFIFILLGAFNAYAADPYWVDDNGAAAWVDCQSAGALSGAAACTITTANANASAGDLVYLREGTYGITISPAGSGSAGNLITFQAYNSETVTIQDVIAINLEDVDYIKIDGIDGLDAGTGSYNMIMIEDGSSYNEITNGHFRRTGEPWTKGYGLMTMRYQGADSEWCTHNWIHDNEMHASGTLEWDVDGAECNDAGKLITIGSSGGVDMYSGYNTFEDNHLYHGGHHILEIETGYNVIRNNIVHNECWMGNYNDMPNQLYTDCSTASHEGCTSCGVGDDRYQKYGGRGIFFTATAVGFGLLEGNRIGHAGRPPDDAGANNIVTRMPNIIIRYNYSFGANSTGIYMREGVDRNAIYNNTVYYNGKIDNGLPFGSANFAGFALVTAGAVDNQVINNIVYNNQDDWDGAYATRWTGTTLRGNWCTANESDFCDGYGDPLFSDTVTAWYDDPSLTGTLPDLTLQSGSPCIDNGSYLTQANGAGSGSSTLIVDDAKFFQDGTWGSSLATLAADWVAVGTVGNVAQISAVNYTTNTITLASPLTWSDDASVWLYKKSDGDTVLFGTAPDQGAYEYVGSEVSGTVFTGGAGNITDDEVVAGGSTIILTLVGTTWDADIGADSAETTALIAGLDSAQSEANGWDAVVKAGLAFGDVTRDSDTQATFLLPAFAGFLITANETVTVTIPSTCTASAVTIIATPNIIISFTETSSTGAGAAYNAGGSNVLYNADGINIVGQ